MSAMTDVRLCWLRRHPVAAFLVVCFGLAWTAGGPAVAAIGVAFGSGSPRELIARVARWRFGLKWYAVALLGPVLLQAMALGLNVLLGGPPPNVPDLTGTVALGVVLALGQSLLTSCEEIGWRGFLLPRLLERFSPLEASLVVGLVWAAWHLVFLALLNVPLTTTPVPALTVFGLATSVVLTWLYRAEPIDGCWTIWRGKQPRPCTRCA
jgi:membrane protease YdiL (CAAX protease family)